MDLTFDDEEDQDHTYDEYEVEEHHIDTPADELMVMLTDNTRFNGPSTQNRRPA